LANAAQQAQQQKVTLLLLLLLLQNGVLGVAPNGIERDTPNLTDM
jgi:hypothetical protein